VELRNLYHEPESRDELSFGALEFHDVFRIFRSGPAETVALRGLDLRVEPRELVALYGPSGSGKSTALHLAAGLDEPSAGDVVAFGRSLARLGEAELAAYRASEVAIVFQSGNLWPGLSTSENVAVGLRLAGRTGGRLPVGRALEAFDLKRRAGQRAGSLSGGEQQRVAIARALVVEPRVILADEPTGNLDSTTGADVIDLLAGLAAQHGATVIVATHDATLAARAPRRLAMRDGRLVDAETPAQVS
jgi:putative ABC transport system ATP-binding protein